MIGQLIIEGLAIGACYGLFGIAVVIIYKTSEVVNFGQGEMAMFSTYVTYHLLTMYQVPFWLAYMMTMIFAILLGMVIEFIFLRPAKNPNLLGLIVITLGVEMLLMGLASWKWGSEQKEFVLPFSVLKTYEPIKGIHNQRLVHCRIHHRLCSYDPVVSFFPIYQIGCGHAGHPAESARG